VTSRRISDLVTSIHPSATLEPELEALLLELADDFVDSVVVMSALLARHRQSKVLDVKDVQLTLQQHWGMRVPGFFSPDDVMSAVGVKGVEEAAAGGGSEGGGGGGAKDFSGGFEGLKGVRVVKRVPMSDGHRKRLQAVVNAKANAAREAARAELDDGQTGSTGEARKRKRSTE